MIKHQFVSAKDDGADESVVRPSDWNADHVDDTPQVSGDEKTAGTETEIRTFSPDDVKDMIATHGGWTLIGHLDKDAGAGASFSFSSIPSTYRHLKILIGFRGTNGTTQVLNMRLNGDTGNNYYYRVWNRFGTVSATTSAMRVGNVPGSGHTANSINVAEITIWNYKNTNWMKDVESREMSLVDDTLNEHQGRWNSVDAIDEILLYPAADNFDQYSYADLYGIL